ncbi:phosphotransferase [Mycobacterium sp. CBMA293]|nr:phosphotransferase [Mycolicibacterium sp. CBMA 360]MUL62533.1 phosphotransferase [Mycolicibacterium sp. CBMA 335]MUL74224.1 phosphotransferase [Mycolicibacterium sp. CBMA 311]MUL96918.1 phosphotransferase [Mycolicibacterium sp. CBMA 230]MUM03966.1 aminoglycoside phosphotransferase [Mycolicibacterium sp. CBMA 213]MUM13298.1 phosphotransferase [Mycolicibacterium sp. CBMA 293]MUM33701.1 phosphotransferase [Mycolicibacterium sp. CBMA 361]
MGKLGHTAKLQYPVDPRSDVALLDFSENATFKVTDFHTGELSVIRVHRLNYHSYADVQSELAWLTALRSEEGVRTPKVLPGENGELAVRFDPRDGKGPRMCVRFEFLPGDAPAEDNLLTEFERLGSITARMHRHAKSWSRPEGFTRFNWTYESAFGPNPRWGDWRKAPGVGHEQRVLLERLQSVLHGRLRSYHENSRFGLIHADLRLANLLIADDEAAVIDFDDCGFGWYMYDLATALTFIEHAPEVPGLIEQWLAGYGRVLPIDTQDRREVWTFILFRRLLVLAWIASHSTVDIAVQQGTHYTEGTCLLAERYLSVNG